MSDNTIFENEKDLTVSIVTYNSAGEIDVLLSSLQKCFLFDKMAIYVVDNASKDNTIEFIKEKYPWCIVIQNHGNIGFGKAHNLVIKNVRSKYHIIVNPDIFIPEDSILNAASFMNMNPDVVLMTPYMLNSDGTQQFLPKRNPSFKYLFGGMFEKHMKFCKKLREEYTRKNENIADPVDVEFCTGAFMFARTEALHRIGGFDERYFLHFEDADLTRELRKVGRTVYNPDIKIIHKWHRENRKINKSFWIALKSMFIYMRKWKKENI